MKSTGRAPSGHVCPRGLIRSGASRCPWCASPGTARKNRRTSSSWQKRSSPQWRVRSSRIDRLLINLWVINSGHSVSSPKPRPGKVLRMRCSDEDAVRDLDTFLQQREAVLLEDEAEKIVNACHAMAVRFHRGGKLVVFGNGGTSTDAQHVAVEFVHPVIVGKRALPAISLTNDIATLTGVAAGVGMDEVFAHQIHHLADPVDIALGISSDGECENVLRGLQVSRQLGLLTIALTGGSGGKIASAELDHVLNVRSSDPRVVKEMHVTTYHVLWELVHVFFEQPSCLESEVVK